MKKIRFKLFNEDRINDLIENIFTIEEIILIL